MLRRDPDYWNRRNEPFCIGRLTPLRSAATSTSSSLLNRTYTISENNPGEVDILVIDHKNTSFDSEIGDDQKQFLEGFQVLEAVDKILNAHNEGRDFLNELDVSFCKIIRKPVTKRSGSNTSSLSFENLQRLAFFHDKLKLLLKEWSYTGLRRSCFVHLKELRRFVKTVIGVAAEEYSKLKLLAYGKHIDGTNIYFGKRQTLLNQLELHTSHWSQILQTVHRLINVFHLEWDSSLNILLSRTQSALAALLNEAFFWVYSILLTDYELLVSNDQSQMSAEMLQNFYRTSDTYIKLLSERKWRLITNRKCSVCFFSFNCSLCSVEDFSYTLLMKMLGRLQGKNAAIHVLEILSFEMKKLGIFNNCNQFYWLANKFTPRPGTETSDYYSASQSERSHEVVQANASNSFAVALISMLQTYQSSLLKHLFALTCIQSLQPDNPKPHEARRRRRRQNSTTRQTWSRTNFRPSIESSSTLEKIFWTCFWQNMEMHTLTLSWNCAGKLQKTGCLGLFSVLPSYLTTLLWKRFIGSDLSEMHPDMLLSMQHLFQQLIFYSELSAWNERFCIALSSCIGIRNVPVPLTNNSLGTRCGKLMCDVLEPIVAAVFTSKENTLISMKVLLYLQCTVDHLINWAVVRQASYLSGWSISLYLVVGLSDLKVAYETLEILGKNWLENYPLLAALLGTTWKLPSQMEILKGIQHQLPVKLHEETYQRSVELFESEMPKVSYWRRKRKGERNLYVLELVKSILEPIVGTSVKLEASLQPGIFHTTAESVGKAWLDTIFKKKLKFSISGAEHLEDDLHYVQAWISKCEALNEAQEKFFSSSSFSKLNRMVRVLTSETPVSRPLSGPSHNRIAPQAESVEENAFQFLTNEERESWERLRAGKSYLICCS